MDDEKRIYNRLIITEKYAMLSKGHGNRNSGFGCRVAATIWIRNRLVSYGINSDKSSPFQAKFGISGTLCPHIFSPIYLHAEIAAIHRALKHVKLEKLKKASIYVVRVKKIPNNTHDIQWGISKPCEVCMGAIVEFGIKKVYWSLDEDVLKGKKYGFMNMREFLELEHG